MFKLKTTRVGALVLPLCLIVFIITLNGKSDIRAVLTHETEILGRVTKYSLSARTVVSETPNGCRVATIEDYGMFVDGKEMKGYVQRIPVFSPNGRHVAFELGDKVIVDGKPIGTVGRFSFRQPPIVFSNDGIAKLQSAQIPKTCWEYCRRRFAL